MDYFDKEAFHKKYAKILRAIATKGLKLQRGEFEVRRCKGGPAILGNVILHTDTLYVTIGGSLVDANDADQQFLYRSCVGRKDYTGGRNRWMNLRKLTEDVDGAIRAFREAAIMSGKEDSYPGGSLMQRRLP